MDNNIFISNTYSVAYAVNQDVGEEWNDIKWDNHHHHIQYHRLYLLTEGTASIQLYNRTLELMPGYVYLVPAYSVKKSHVDGTMNKYYIHFQSDQPVFTLFRYISTNYSVKANNLTEDLFRIVVENYHSNTVESRCRVQGAMNLILSDFLAEVFIDSPTIKKFGKVISYIDANYNKKINNSDLATIMNVSTAYFANYFKETFNISPKQYILNKRLAESQRLLLETSMSIKEIAFAVGFENENYFSEFFAQKIGVSALKYRKRAFPKERESIL